MTTVTRETWAALKRAGFSDAAALLLAENPELCAGIQHLVLNGSAHLGTQVESLANLASKHPQYCELTREECVFGICAYAVQNNGLKPAKYSQQAPIFISLEALQKGITSEYYQ